MNRGGDSEIRLKKKISEAHGGSAAFPRRADRDRERERDEQIYGVGERERERERYAARIKR